MTARQRLRIVGVALAGVLCGLLLLVFAANACPGPSVDEACPAAATNRAIVVALAALATGLLVAPFAFLAEFLARRRIVYRGAWSRAARRATLVAASVAAFAGLRLGNALTVPVGLFILTVAVLTEWFATRRLDAP